MGTHVAPVGEDFYDRMREARRKRTSPITPLERPVPLWPRHSKVMVHGVATDAEEGVRRYWLQLGRAANAGKMTTVGKD